MFREMRRKKQQLSTEDCLRLLKKEPRGVLSLLGDDGYPYGVPMDYWYNEGDGCLYFHCAKAGHKTDAIHSCPKAFFCVMDQGFRREGEWPLNIQSVIVFGKIQFLEDQEQLLSAVRQLGLKYYPDSNDVEQEIQRSLRNVQMFRLVPEHITGKLVKES